MSKIRLRDLCFCPCCCASADRTIAGRWNCSCKRRVYEEFDYYSIPLRVVAFQFGTLLHDAEFMDLYTRLDKKIQQTIRDNPVLSTTKKELGF